MDMQNRVGSKPGSGGVASGSESNVNRRERLRQLALETIDLAKDPYLMKNHLGHYECKLCLTLHTDVNSYLTHTQGKRHQENLARRVARSEKSLAGGNAQSLAPIIRKTSVKIGRPGYKVTKIRDPFTRQLGIIFQLHYPQIENEIKPRYRFMSAYEQRVEAPDRNFQYILFAAEPYETVGFRIPSKDIDKREEKLWTFWDQDAKLYTVQLFFSLDQQQQQ